MYNKTKEDIGRETECRFYLRRSRRYAGWGDNMICLSTKEVRQALKKRRRLAIVAAKKQRRLDWDYEHAMQAIEERAVCVGGDGKTPRDAFIPQELRKDGSPKRWYERYDDYTDKNFEAIKYSKLKLGLGGVYEGNPDRDVKLPVVPGKEEARFDTPESAEQKELTQLMVSKHYTKRSKAVMSWRKG